MLRVRSLRREGQSACPRRSPFDSQAGVRAQRFLSTEKPCALTPDRSSRWAEIASFTTGDAQKCAESEDAMGGPMKPIETRYQGYRFRSRLEARWAVFFDAEGLTWEYERQGYDLGDGLLYLPDFWLPQVWMWAEVKPDEFDGAELEKAWRLFALTGHPVLFLVGPPAVAAY